MFQPRLSFSLLKPGVKTMKARKIYLHDAERLQSAIDKAEGRATQRCLSATECAERLDKCNLCGMPKSRLKDCAVVLHGSNEKMPQSYRYPAQCTQVTFRHDGKDWVFVSAKRDYIHVRTSSRHGVEYVLTDDAKYWLVEYFSWY
jgi:hypothetical protein